MEKISFEAEPVSSSGVGKLSALFRGRSPSGGFFLQPVRPALSFLLCLRNLLVPVGCAGNRRRPSALRCHSRRGLPSVCLVRFAFYGKENGRDAWKDQALPGLASFRQSFL